MIKALRVSISGNVPYENVAIYSRFAGDILPDVPDIFEDSQLVIVCKDGRFILPDYQVVIIQLAKGRQHQPHDCYKVSRIRLSDDQMYENCLIIPKESWDKMGVPQIFKEFEQLVFTCKDGLFVTSDYNVMDIKC